MYWALAPEADHTVAYARGGSSDIANLTTLHTMCNAKKGDALVSDLPHVELPARVHGWDGLVSAYPSVVAMGDSQGRRHSAAEYHARWLRYFSQAMS
ncbi:hypothetical protein CVS47_02161 [Microbacterium lemovicicum]|uniref:HNH domain-containing protein n=2 Tax=Microbacterium lemovicicum TaxID=1072463 RepID=A0A3Q9J3D0_9MICO|nr:hypothetical protein CVS47_02161 [Microbacterium lemovicicum]